MFSDKIFLKFFKKNCGKHSSKIYVHLSMTVKMERKKINTFYINDIVVQIFMAVNYS